MAIAEDPADREVARRANELYWGSARSVNSIANELGLSKGKFYGVIAPLPAASPCPTCGGPTVYGNRSERDRDRPTCPACEAAAQGRPVPMGAGPAATPPRSAPSLPDEGAAPPASPPPASPALPRRTPARPSPAPTTPTATRVVAGFLIGGLAGLFLYRLARRGR